MSTDFVDLFFNHLYPIGDVEKNLQCGRPYHLTIQEKAVSELAFFLRNLNLGLQFSIKNQFHPGPHGRKDAKGRWWPSIQESCDAYVGHWKEEVPEMGKGRFDPWALWKHCKSLQHTEYLVKNRLIHLVDSTFNGIHLGVLKELLDIIEKDIRTPYPPLRSGKHWLIDRYFDDLSTGKFEKPYKNNFIKNTRFDLLKQSIGGMNG